MKSSSVTKWCKNVQIENASDSSKKKNVTWQVIKERNDGRELTSSQWFPEEKLWECRCCPLQCQLVRLFLDFFQLWLHLQWLLWLIWRSSRHNSWWREDKSWEMALTLRWSSKAKTHRYFCQELFLSQLGFQVHRDAIRFQYSLATAINAITDQNAL